MDVDIGDGEANGCELSRKARPQVSLEVGGGEEEEEEEERPRKKAKLPSLKSSPNAKGNANGMEKDNGKEKNNGKEKTKTKGKRDMPKPNPDSYKQA